MTEDSNHIAVVSELTTGQINDLWHLFQQEWWTKNRTLPDTRNVVDGSQVVIGLIDTTKATTSGGSVILTDGSGPTNSNNHNRNDIDDEGVPVDTRTITSSATVSGKLIGFVRVLTDYTIKALVFDVIVSSDYRGRGYGTRLLQEVLSCRALRHVQHFELYCKPEMVALYAQPCWQFTQANVGDVVLLRKIVR